MGKVFTGLFILFLTISCGKITPLSELQAEDLLNLQYGTNERNILDVYLPGNRGPETKTIVLLHGGSWSEGDKGSFTEVAKLFRSKGYACVSLNYRLTHTIENNVHPAQIDDVRRAMEFLATKAGEWQIAPDQFALLGASAGAHLALLYAYKYDENDRIKTIISVSGPTNLADTRSVSPQALQVTEWLMGFPLQQDPEAYRLASPITYVSAESPPTLMFHGAKDDLVPQEQAIDLKSKLDQFNITSKLVIYPDAGHEVLNINNTGPFLIEVDNWLTEYLR